MGLILGSAALFISLLSLWLVGEASQRKNNQSEALVTAHVKRVKVDVDVISSALTRSDEVIKSLVLRIDVLEAEIKAQKLARTDSREALAGLEKNTRARNEGSEARTKHVTQQSAQQSGPSKNRGTA